MEHYGWLEIVSRDNPYESFGLVSSWNFFCRICKWAIDVSVRKPLGCKKAVYKIELQGKSAVTSPAADRPPPEQINALIGLYNRGQFLEVLKRGNMLAAQYPTEIVLHNILGAANASIGKPDDAVASYTKALRLNPEFAEAHNNLGEALRIQGKLDDAIASYNKALHFKPDYVSAYNNRGAALKSAGKVDEAIASFSKAIRINPEIAEVHSNLGVALKDVGKFDDAIVSYRRAIDLNPRFAEAHTNLGVAFGALGRLDEAIVSHLRAIQIKPDYAEAHGNLGVALNELGKPDQAFASLTKALQIKPEFAEAHNNLGIVLNVLERHDDAIESYRKALRVKPDHIEAHSNICALYEKLNRIPELEDALEIAQKNCEGEIPEILLMQARHSIRKNNYNEALQFLSRISPENLSLEIKEAYFTSLGKTYDKLGQFSEAFDSFERQNEVSKLLLSSSKKNDAEAYLNGTLQLAEAWTSIEKLHWTVSPTEDGDVSLAFLVGFPRSGTTLLDTILRSHSGIAVVEEKHMVRKMLGQFGRTPSIEELNKLTFFEISLLRKEYFKELKVHLDDSDLDKLIIDKYPLNIRRVGFIHKVFPKAKFILALRHPCDCVLSCFMQNFKINDAMANFLTLEQTAKLYAAVMELWRSYQETLELDVGVLKYEDLVQDLRGTCVPLLEFLGLDWDENLLNYQKTAENRGLINTPSYNQVTQPLYLQASGRWENYRENMAPVFPILEPWIEEFGYQS